MRLHEIQAAWHRVIVRLGQMLTVAQARTRIATRHHRLAAQRIATRLGCRLGWQRDPAVTMRIEQWRENATAWRLTVASRTAHWRAVFASRAERWRQDAAAWRALPSLAARWREDVAAWRVSLASRAAQWREDAVAWLAALASRAAQWREEAAARLAASARRWHEMSVALQDSLAARCEAFGPRWAATAARIRQRSAANSFAAAAAARARAAIAAARRFATAIAAREVVAAARRFATAIAVRGVVATAGRFAPARAAFWVALQRRATGIPDGVRVLAACVLVLAAIIGISYGAGRLGGTAVPVAEAVASPSSLPAPPTPQAIPAVIPAPLDQAPRIVPLSRLNPITGPDRPPLPDDENGPYGSRRTTGTYEVALTFDDGPDPRWTPAVLELLRLHRIRATFCLVGVNVVAFPNLVRDIASDGHTLCNHSWAHDTGLGSRAHATIISDMARTNEAIQAAAPRARISYFRHPGGAWTQAAVDAARKLGMTSLHWDVDPRDWLRPGPRAIAGNVTSSAVPGSIVLLHDGGGDRRGTADALRTILPNLAARFPLVALPPGIDPPRRHGIHLPVHLGQQ